MFLDESVSVWRYKVDTLHDYDGSRHETHPFSIYQHGSEAFHDPQLETHAVHTGTNIRPTFLLLISASISYIGCHCGVHVRV